MMPSSLHGASNSALFDIDASSRRLVLLGAQAIPGGGLSKAL
jgi:hypothetical protein